MASGGWSSSNRRSTLPHDWPRVRNHVLKRDGRVCQIRGPFCMTVATEVDHIGDPEDHRPESLRAVCVRCHAIRSGRQGADASLTVRKAIIAARRRPAEKHPGLLD
jgi:5-methylcytosine-specific restriction protein A